LSICTTSRELKKHALHRSSFNNLETIESLSVPNNYIQKRNNKRIFFPLIGKIELSCGYFIALIQEIIRQGGLAKDFKNVGFAEIILTGCWFIWWKRRQVVHGEEIQNHQEQRSQQTML
jgi:hypothetical protein